MSRTQALALWALSILSALLFLPASYVGVGGLAALSKNPSPFVASYGLLCVLLSAVCVAGPLLAWRSVRASHVRRAFALALLPLAALAAIVLFVLLGHRLLGLLS